MQQKKSKSFIWTINSATLKRNKKADIDPITIEHDTNPIEKRISTCASFQYTPRINHKTTKGTKYQLEMLKFICLIKYIFFYSYSKHNTRKITAVILLTFYVSLRHG